MIEKYRRDLEEDDKKHQQQIFSSVIYGINKKRKRGDVEGLDDDDNYNDRKQKRIQER